MTPTEFMRKFCKHEPKSLKKVPDNVTIQESAPEVKPKVSHHPKVA